LLELSLHILDIVENSTRSGAKIVQIRILEDEKKDRLSLEIRDDGRGMDGETLRRALDPFFTTKEVRRVGLGLPMLAEAAERAGGHFQIVSGIGEGTTVRAEFLYSHIDRQPLGDMAGTLVALIAGNPDVDFFYRHEKNGRSYTLDTAGVRRELGGVSIHHPKVLSFLRREIRQGLDGIGVET
jgi:hypothetical protein